MSQEKIKELQQRIKENPADNEAIEAYAIALSDIGENEEALKHFIFLKNKFPENAQHYYNIGIILEKIKRFDDAILAYEKALKIEPEDTDIMFNLGLANIKIEDYDEAEKLFLKVLEKDNDDENSYFHLGEIYTRKKQFDNSVKYLKKAVELDNKDIIAKFYLAYSLHQLGETEIAIKTYNEVIEQSPDYSWAYYNLASIYIDKNDDNTAISYLEKTIQTNPADLKAITMLVKVLSKNKKFLQAEKILNQALTILPEEADIYYLLSRIYTELKNTVNRIKYLKLTISKKITFSGDIEDVEEELKELEKQELETKKQEQKPAAKPTPKPAPRPTPRPTKK